MDTDSLRFYIALFLWAACMRSSAGECPFPKRDIANGRYVYQVAHDVNKTNAPESYLLRFRCHPSYTLKGVKAILCINSKWTDRLPSCIKMSCNDPPAIPNGSFKMEGCLGIGCSVTFSCDAGYELDNATDSVLTCHLFPEINEAQWSGIVPKCRKRETCSDPGVSNDGQRHGECCYVGNSLQFTCNDEFELLGEKEIECLPGGRWSSPRPLCKPLSDHCDPPPPIPRGVTRGDKEGDFYRPYDEVQVMCQPGYRYIGASEYVLCEEEVGWESEFEECVESECDRPEILLNGTIPEIESINSTSFPFNFELTYICDKGFRLIGDSWRFCDTKGWSGKNPYCEEIRCPDPGAPEYGTKIGSNFEIGQKVVFSCFPGYELIGSFERYCTPNGQWSGELARCNHPDNYCPNPGTPVNGMKNSSDYELGDKVLFRCYAGYTLVGSNIRECLPSRIWSGDEVKCLGHYEFDNSAQIGEILKAAIAEKEAEQKRNLDEYHEALFATWHNDSDGPVGRMLRLNFPGRLIFYFAFDVSGSVREHNFRKSVEFAKAIVKRVGITPNGARAGALTFSSQSHIAFLPMQYDTTEGVLQALDDLNFTGGGTSANSALTQIREELIPLTKKWLGKEGEKAIKSVVFILTDGKANMGGDPIEQAEQLKKSGVEIYALGITDSNLQDSLYKIASGQEGQHVFILQNYATMAYLIEEITNGSIDYSKCGLGLEKLGKQANPGRIAGGGQASDPWPWMAAIYFVSLPTEADVQCGGSIIHESFILTAAHCLYDPVNFALRKEKHVIVKLGLTNVKNQSSMQEFEVKAFYIHPEYKARPSAFDYDIALLQLKRPIEYSALIRPICLPPTILPEDTNLYQPGQLTVATGWGHAGVIEKEKVNVKPEEHLKEVILPIQSNDRCMQSVLDHGLPRKTFTDRMFCAGDGKGGNDTCRGDSGGPIMQSQINEDGYTYWIQVGIVSWGIGCGRQNTYGYYTYLQKFHDWIIRLLPNTKPRTTTPNPNE